MPDKNNNFNARDEIEKAAGVPDPSGRVDSGVSTSAHPNSTPQNDDDESRHHDPPTAGNATS